METLFNYAIAFVCIIGVIAGIAKHDFWKRKNEYMETVQQKNKYKRTTRKIDILLATSIILLLALYYFQSDDIQDPVAKIVEEPVTAGDIDSESGKVIELGPYSVAAIPNGVPPAYQMQYEELTDIISRATATLTLIKGTISSCETPCAEPLSEIESKFDAMNNVIEETRNKLFRGSEIARVMAEEDPKELHTQKLHELQQELLSTRSSLETMQIADSWESWEEPIDYVESTRTKRLYKISLADTVLMQQENKEESTDSEIPYPFASTQAEADFFTTIGLTLENGIATMRDASSMSRVCGKVCPDVPGSDWGLQLEPMNQEVFELDHNLYDFARSLRDIPKGSSPNIDFEARDILVNDMERMSDYISLLMTHNDWSTWQDAWDTMDEANLLIEKMYALEVYTVPR